MSQWAVHPPPDWLSPLVDHRRLCQVPLGRPQTYLGRQVVHHDFRGSLAGTRLHVVECVNRVISA